VSGDLFDEIVVADHNLPFQTCAPQHTIKHCDVRRPIPVSLAGEGSPDWIVVLAAVHREPGHEPREYFETNIVGARQIAAYANSVGCDNIFFMSSTSVYGPTVGPTDDESLTCPVSPYGVSKLAAELIMEAWQKEKDGRRLVICRPGVVYGPGDPGNVLRMINAVRHGRFAFPGDRSIRKSYAYIETLIDSFHFTVRRREPLLVYNLVERDTETLEVLVRCIQDEFGCRRRVISVPSPLLMGAAHVAQALTRSNTPIHPVRVRKAAMPTHIVPKWLIEHGFGFRFDFRSSLKHWRATAPEDFTAE
jgi:nucleoside-diphosphate-sugar epimerase